jgi:hypothetical protein
LSTKSLFLVFRKSIANNALSSHAKKLLLAEVTEKETSWTLENGATLIELSNIQSQISQQRQIRFVLLQSSRNTHESKIRAASSARRDTVSA